MHYNFTSKEAMSAAIEEGRFLEFAQVHTNLYGTRYVTTWVCGGLCCGSMWIDGSSRPV